MKHSEHPEYFEVRNYNPRKIFRLLFFSFLVFIISILILSLYQVRTSTQIELDKESYATNQGFLIMNVDFPNTMFQPNDTVLIRDTSSPNFEAYTLKRIAGNSSYSDLSLEPVSKEFGTNIELSDSIFVKLSFKKSLFSIIFKK